MNRTPFAEDVKPSVPGKPYWWQWPTILSLDAPAVVLAWQWLLAHTNGSGLRGYHRFILGASVWLAYVADRWIEAWRLAPAQLRTQRHHFHRRARWPLAGLWLVVLAVAVGTSLQRLTPREFAAGGLLLATVLAYLLSHQLAHRHHPWRVPKELCVALLLTAGVALFPCAQPIVRLPPVLLTLFLFSLLCFANCVLISTWERDVDRTQGQTSLALQFQRAGTLSRVLPWVIIALAAVAWMEASGPGRTAAECALASGVLLGGVDRLQTRTGWQLARVLADAALLTPLVPLLAKRWS